MNELKFEFSDTITGYVTGYNKAKKTFTLKTSDGREFTARTWKKAGAITPGRWRPC